MHPETDIVCLVHNQLKITKGFVHNLFENTKNFNLIFVDNDSTDGTSEWLKEGMQNGRWKAITAEKDGKPANLGVIGGRNLGARNVTSDYFLNIDNDQYVGPGWLDALHQRMANGYDIVGCEAWKLVPPKQGGIVVVGGKTYKRSYFPYKRCINPKDDWAYIGCGGMLIRKSVYDKIGLFDERFSPAYFEDPDFCWRALRAGFRLSWCPECKITHLAHQTFNSQNLFDKNVQFVQSWTRFKEKWNGWFPNKGDLK